MSLRNLSGAWWQMFIAKIQSLNPGPRLSVQREDQFFSASPKFFQWYTQYSKDLQARNSHTLPTGTWRGRAPINSIAKRSSCEVQSCSGHCHWVELTLCQIPHRSRSVPQISRDFVWSSKTLQTSLLIRALHHAEQVLQGFSFQATPETSRAATKSRSSVHLAESNARHRCPSRLQTLCLSLPKRQLLLGICSDYSN